jgi:hydroxypyruvate isomerase
MKRRNFMQSSMLAGSALLTGGIVNAAASPKNTSAAAGKPFNLNYGIHDGMFKNHAGDDFVDQIKFAYDKGFRSIEDNGMSGRPKISRKK